MLTAHTHLRLPGCRLASYQDVYQTSLSDPSIGPISSSVDIEEGHSWAFIQPSRQASLVDSIREPSPSSYALESFLSDSIVSRSCLPGLQYVASDGAETEWTLRVTGPYGKSGSSLASWFRGVQRINALCIHPREHDGATGILGGFFPTRGPGRRTW